MSDRTCLSEVTLKDGNTIQLFMDGESGTWRVFIGPESTCADFTLSELRSFHAVITQALVDIEKEPDSYNAEVRKAMMYL